MLTINAKALKYAKKKELYFVVKILTRTIECAWNGTRTQGRSLSVKASYEYEVEIEYYDIFEFQGVKVFISKELKIKGDINIYQKLKIPFMAPVFGVKGVDIY